MKRLLFFALALCVLATCFSFFCGAEELEETEDITIVETEMEESLEEESLEEESLEEESLEEESLDWQALLEEKIFPLIAAVISGAGGVYALILPILLSMKGSTTKVDAAAELFAGATERISKATEDQDTVAEKMAAFERSLAEYKETMQEERRAWVEKQSFNEERFIRLIQVFARVFASSEELVRSGAAREMMKVVEEYVGEQK